MGVPVAVSTSNLHSFQQSAVDFLYQVINNRSHEPRTATTDSCRDVHFLAGIFHACSQAVRSDAGVEPDTLLCLRTG
jgi:hypothetical protein